ncbi:MAG TPA: hypothetical protein VHT25_05045 [Solirubrobacteraceae bacterium]|jgi:hypothetical protein|nr:hypothetical protein [Solirubrobacteraceae bacterium]
MGGERRFSAGQRVIVELDGETIEGVFVRYAPQQGGVNVKGAARAAAAVGWVRRSDTGEIEPFEYGLISAA